MTKNAGERLFDAIGQIPDEMIKEAERMDRDITDSLLQKDQAVQDQAAYGPEEKEGRTARGPERKQSRIAVFAAKTGGYLKYLPVAACLCIVFGSVSYIVDNYMRAENSSGFSMSGGSQDAGGIAFDDQSAEMGMEEDAGGSDEKMSGESMEAPAADEDGSDADGGVPGQPLLPVRYGAYAGPVFPVTATGDTQKLRVSRTLKGVITTEGSGVQIQPLLQVTDSYRIKNTSNEDKTVQVLYPFVSALNQDQNPGGEILQIHGQPVQASYSMGGSIAAYEDIDVFSKALGAESMKDYQEQALEKEADWGREVTVYTFSVQEAAGQSCVAGVTVNGAGADVLTYGFDHSFEREEGVSNYCFFVPQEQEDLYLIVTGETEGEPEIGFYTNLDCVEKADSVRYQMQRQRMTYADALRLCSTAALQQTEQKYAQGLFDAQLPEYMDSDAAFQVLTVISEEEDFYDTLKERYGGTELKEILERMFGETRIVYAMATVTIPAKHSVRVTARTQKQQEQGHYMLKDAKDAGEDFRYDFLSESQSRLQIKKTAFRLEVAKEWEVSDQDAGLVKKRDSVWEAEFGDEEHYFVSVRRE